MSFAKTGYLLQKDARDEQEELEKAARKKGLWSSVGSALGGIAALGLTATAGPVVAALATGALSGIGGLAGGELLTSKKNKDLLKGSGGKFHKGSREELSDIIKEDILKSSISSAVSAGALKGVDKIKSTSSFQPRPLADFKVPEIKPMQFKSSLVSNAPVIKGTANIPARSLTYTSPTNTQAFDLLMGAGY